MDNVAHKQPKDDEQNKEMIWSMFTYEVVKGPNATVKAS